ncbi:MAG: hypothetical protein KAT38_06200, partial [Bacteroidales bacterium]|nr:hypothetical protein [Bacteroidales bacterium]
MRKTILILLALLILFPSSAQYVFHHLSNTNLYNFLDEMANNQIINLNSAYKPYSRTFIANKLQEIESQKDKLNTRQIEDLIFFLKDFNKELKPDKEFDKRLDLLYKKDSVFT